MKNSIQFILLLICVIVFTSFMLITDNEKRSTANDYVKTNVIKVSLDASGTGLILDDGKSKGGNITTEVSKKSIIKWKLVPNSGISSLDSIASKNGVDVFEAKPKKNKDNELIGDISDVPSGTVEEYGIYFTINGVTYMHDPKIQIR